MSSPIVSFDGVGYEITLFRPDATGAVKEKKYEFGAHNISVCAALESDLETWERAQIEGPVSDNGLIYYICAQPEDVGIPSLIWLQDRDEYLALRKAIEDAKDLYYHMNDDDHSYEDRTCTFCGDMESGCGGDHVDEMRDIQRDYNKRDY